MQGFSYIGSVVHRMVTTLQRHQTSGNLTKEENVQFQLPKSREQDGISRMHRLKGYGIAVMANSDSGSQIIDEIEARVAAAANRWTSLCPGEIRQSSVPNGPNVSCSR